MFFCCIRWVNYWIFMVYYWFKVASQCLGMFSSIVLDILGIVKGHQMLELGPLISCRNTFTNTRKYKHICHHIIFYKLDDVNWWRFQKVNVSRLLEFQFFRVWTCGIWPLFWNVTLWEMLKWKLWKYGLGNVELMKFENSKLWNFKVFEGFKFEITKPCNFEIPNLFLKFRKRQGPDKMKIRLISFWKSWIWDQYLLENMKWHFCDFLAMWPHSHIAIRMQFGNNMQLSENEIHNQTRSFLTK